MLKQNRAVLNVKGKEAALFLSSLLTKQVNKENATYALLLTPKGKFLYDFFLVEYNNGVFLEVSEHYKNEILVKLNSYKFRANIDIEITPLNVYAEIGTELEDIQYEAKFLDPRNISLGYRIWSNSLFISVEEVNKYEKLRILALVPEMGRELYKESGFPSQYNLEKAIDFNKGCYIGQEITNRIKRGLLNIKEKLYIIEGENLPTFGENIYFENKKLGVIYSHVENTALGLLNIAEVECLQKEYPLLETPTFKIYKN